MAPGTQTLVVLHLLAVVGLAPASTVASTDDAIRSTAQNAATPEAPVVAGVEAESAVAGVCGQIQSMAPSCVSACRSSCGAVDAAAGAYSRGGRRGAVRSVCGNRWAFECFFRHYGACSALISKAAGHGFPSSIGSLRSQCSRQMEAAVEGESVEESQVGEMAQGVAESPAPVSASAGERAVSLRGSIPAQEEIFLP